VSTATAPFRSVSMDIPGQATDVAVSDGYAYLVDGDGALLVVDVSTPAHPVEVGSSGSPAGFRMSRWRAATPLSPRTTPGSSR